MPRSTRRTTAQPAARKENGPQEATSTSKKARHRLSTTELARLEDMFRQDTHPSRQQKKDLAAQLGMDYKTITIWFQNKRQTSKRSQPPVQRLDTASGRTRADSCLRTVSSPSLNATLDVSTEVVPTASSLEVKGNSIASRAIVKIKPLLDSLNTLTSRPRQYSESADAKGEGQDAKDINPHRTQTSPENAIVSTELNTREQEQTKGNSKTDKWKRMRTLEWACERQAKRRKLSREGYVRFGSAQPQDGDPNDTHMDSALSLLSLASSTQVGPPKDVMRGASLLLSFKHSWRRK